MGLTHHRILIVISILVVLAILSHGKRDSRANRHSAVTTGEMSHDGKRGKHVSSPIGSRKMRRRRVMTEKPDTRHRSKSAIVPERKVPFATKAMKSIEIWKERIMLNAEAALEKTHNIQRHLKEYFSSDFEVLLLRITEPEDSKPGEDDVERLLGTVETFVRNMDVTSQSNPYRVTLRKLWTKAAEPEGHTVLKSLYLLHTLLRETTPDDCIIFKTLMNKMMREKCKKTKSKYFDTEKLLEVTHGTANLQDFIGRYFAFIAQRTKTFTSGFEEMKLIESGMRTEDICAQMMKAYKVLDSALICTPTTDEESSDTVLACLELLAKDVRDLFELFHVKLIWLLREEESGDIFVGWERAEVRAVLSHFKSFYNDRYEDVESFLSDIAKLVRKRFGTSFRIELPSPALFQEEIPVFNRTRRSSGSSGSGGSGNSRTSSGESSSGEIDGSASASDSGSASLSLSSLPHSSSRSSRTPPFDIEAVTKLASSLDAISPHSDLGAVTDNDNISGPGGRPLAQSRSRQEQEVEVDPVGYGFELLDRSISKSSGVSAGAKASSSVTASPGASAAAKTPTVDTSKSNISSTASSLDQTETARSSSASTGTSRGTRRRKSNSNSNSNSSGSSGNKGTVADGPKD